MYAGAGSEDTNIHSLTFTNFSGGLNCEFSEMFVNIPLPGGYYHKSIVPQDLTFAKWSKNVMFYGNRLRSAPGFIPALNGPLSGDFSTTPHSYVLGAFWSDANRYSIPIVADYLAVTGTSDKLYAPAVNTSGNLFPFSGTSSAYVDITGGLTLHASACVSLQFNQKLIILDTSVSSVCLFSYSGSGPIVVLPTVLGTIPILAQPGIPQQLSLVSTSAGDTTQTVTIVGSGLLGAPISETLAVNGLTPVVTASSGYMLVTSITVTGTLAGVVTITDVVMNKVIATFGGSASPDAGRCLANYADKLWVGNFIHGGVRYSNMMAFSAVNDETTWNFANGTVNFETDDGDEISGALSLGPDLIVYKKYSICKISGYDASDTAHGFAITRPFVSGVGCTLPRTLQSVSIQGPHGFISAHIFWSALGLCIFDGYSVQTLPNSQDNSSPCKFFFDAINQTVSLSSTTNTGNEDSFRSAFDPNRGIYYFYGPSMTYVLPPGSQTNTSSCESYTFSGFAYDVLKNALWPLELAFTPQGSCVYVDSNGKRKILLGGPYAEFSELTYDDSYAALKSSFSDLVTNGNMETNGTWTDYNTPTSQAQDGTQYRNGTKSWKVVGDAGKGAQQSITTAAGKLYRASGWVYTPASAGKLSYIKVRDTVASTTLATITFTATAAAKWQFGYVDFVKTTANATILTLESGSTGNTQYFDDVHVFLHKYDSVYRTPDLLMAGITAMKATREVGILAGLNNGARTNGAFDVAVLPDGIVADGGATTQQNATATFVYSGTAADAFAVASGCEGCDFRRVSLRFSTPSKSGAYPLLGQPFPPLQEFTYKFSIYGDRFIS